MAIPDRKSKQKFIRVPEGTSLGFLVLEFELNLLTLLHDVLIQASWSRVRSGL